MQRSLGAYNAAVEFGGAATAFRPRHRRARSSSGMQPTRAVADPAVFEPVFNGGAAATALGTIALPGAYWWFVIVPSERRSLAKAKRTGEVRVYLEEIAEGSADRAVERWFYTDWLEQSWFKAAQKKKRAAAAAAASAAASASGASSAPSSEAGDGPIIPPSDAALRGDDEDDVEPAFFNLDNPIVFAAAALIAFAAFQTLLRALH